MYLMTLCAAVLCIVKNDSAAEGVISSLKLCASTVVPSLLPFMVLSSYIVSSGMASDAGRMFEIPCRKIFRLSGEAGFIILMSLVGGFPVGAKMTASAVEKGILTENQGRRMMLFCVNAGPAFIINIVGQSMLGSRKAGMILLTATVSSSLFVGFISRFFDNENGAGSIHQRSENKSAAFISAVEGSVKTVIMICGWIVVFGALRNIIGVTWIPREIKLWADMLFEVTEGCRFSSKNFPLPVTAFVLGFSGLAVHAQILPFLDSVNLKYRLFFSSRIISGAVAAVLSAALLHFFPCEIQTFAADARIIPISYSVSVYASISAIITASLIILDLAPTRKV